MSKDLYLKELEPLRKELRTNETAAEKHLWSHLRKMQLGYKFRRQVSIGYYIVDFYCQELALAIELDGPVHNQRIVKEKDQIRQEIIESTGVTVLRLSNKDVLENIGKTVKFIQDTCLSLNKRK